MSSLPTAAITRDLGQFAASYRTAPQGALDVARSGVLDAIGLLLAARPEAVVRSARTVAGQGGPTGRSSILLSAERSRASDAAMVNAVASHAHAMDDVAWGCHPSAMLMPALVACGEEAGASGADLLRAWVVGYEVLAELASREPDSLHPSGWHPTGLLGPVAGAAAVCNLRGLTAETASRAMGIAASMGGGLSVNFGTQTKALHLGRVAQSALLAVELALQGVTAAADALERAGSGLLATISPAGRVDLIRPVALPDDALQKESLRVLTTGIGIKKYPLCYSVHRVADAAIDLSRTPGFDPAQVARIDIAVGRRQAKMARHMQPGNALEARYSVAFAAASGLLTSAAGFAQLEQGFITSEPTQRLIAATHLTLLDGVNPQDPTFSESDRVRVTLVDGRQLDSGEVPYERGHARLPMDACELRSKFVDCARAGGVRDASGLYGRLLALQDFADVGEIAALVQSHDHSHDQNREQETCG